MVVPMAVQTASAKSPSPPLAAASAAASAPTAVVAEPLHAAKPLSYKIWDASVRSEDEEEDDKSQGPGLSATARFGRM
jgi:hypothetical protein